MTDSELRAAAFVRDPTTLWRRTLDGMVLLPHRSDEVLRITGSGRAVWELLAEPVTLEQLVKEVSETFEEPPDEVSRDVTDLLKRLIETGAVVLQPVPG